MAQLGCKCGERMYTSDDPSPYVIYIFHKAEADKAIRDDPCITLHNFLLGWDEQNNCRREYMKRAEAVDYWFCPKCKRIYEVQNIPQGHWLRVFKRKDTPLIERTDDWKQIFAIPDVDVYAVYEESADIRLYDYLQQYTTVLYFLSPDERLVKAVDNESGRALFTYALEIMWSPSSEG